MRHLQITGARYLPRAGDTPEVELAVATRRDERSPQVARVRARAETLVRGPLD